MKASFDFGDVVSVEFGVGYGKIGEDARFVPVGSDVRGSLIQMLLSTRASFDQGGNDWDLFEAAEQYPSVAKLRVPLSLSYVAPLAELRDATNLAVGSQGIKKTESLSFYFATFVDGSARKVLGVRQAAQFKAVLKAQNRLIRWMDDTLRVVEDDVFRLDNEFDLLVNAEAAWVLHPAALETLLDLGESIRRHVVTWTSELHSRVRIVDFRPLGEFARTHKTAARLIAALHARSDLEGVSMKRLKKACTDNEIAVIQKDGRVSAGGGSELAFLQLLDRRRYLLELVEKAPERYVASSRRAARK